jgi:hypothetical protein
MKAKAKPSPEFERFNTLVGRVLSVPKAILDQREKQYQEEAKSSPKRRDQEPRKTTKKSI